MRALAATLCTLEPQVAAHATEMFAVLSDPSIYEFENAPPESAAWLFERFTKLETRTSADGSELWLNWVVRLPCGALAGYTQATVLPTGVAFIACELASRYWRRGLGSCAVAAMIDELAGTYGVHTALAVLKARNFRSLAWLRHLGFCAGTVGCIADTDVQPDELVMCSSIRRQADA